MLNFINPEEFNDGPLKASTIKLLNWLKPKYLLSVPVVAVSKVIFPESTLKSPFTFNLAEPGKPPIPTPSALASATNKFASVSPSILKSTAAPVSLTTISPAPAMLILSTLLVSIFKAKLSLLPMSLAAPAVSPLFAKSPVPLGKPVKPLPSPTKALAVTVPVAATSSTYKLAHSVPKAPRSSWLSVTGIKSPLIDTVVAGENLISPALVIINLPVGVPAKPVAPSDIMNAS